MKHAGWLVAIVLLACLAAAGWGARRLWHSTVKASEPNVIILPPKPPQIYVIHLPPVHDGKLATQKIGDFIGQAGWRYICLSVDNKNKIMVGRADCTNQQKFDAFVKQLKEK